MNWNIMKWHFFLIHYNKKSLLNGERVSWIRNILLIEKWSYLCGVNAISKLFFMFLLKAKPLYSFPIYINVFCALFINQAHGTIFCQLVDMIGTTSIMEVSTSYSCFLIFLKIPDKVFSYLKSGRFILHSISYTVQVVLFCLICSSNWKWSFLVIVPVSCYYIIMDLCHEILMFDIILFLSVQFSFCFFGISLSEYFSAAKYIFYAFTCFHWTDLDSTCWCWWSYISKLCGYHAVVGWYQSSWNDCG